MIIICTLYVLQDLMAKLIKEMPDHPIPYLIKSLKKLHPEDSTHSVRPLFLPTLNGPFAQNLNWSTKQ
jgi:hypothetical protein